MKLENIPEAIVEKAKKRVKKNDVPKRYRSLPLPRRSKRADQKVLERLVSSVGSEYTGTGGKPETLIKRIEQAVKAAERKGATEVVVIHRGVYVIGYRPETDQEFEKRYEDALTARAAFLLQKKRIKDKKIKEQKTKSAQVRLEASMQLQEAAAKLGFKEAQQILNGLVDGTTK